MLVYGALLVIVSNVYAFYVDRWLHEQFHDIGEDRECALLGLW